MAKERLNIVTLIVFMKSVREYMIQIRPAVSEGHD